MQASHSQQQHRAARHPSMKLLSPFFFACGQHFVPAAGSSPWYPAIRFSCVSLVGILEQ
uniref:Uncharacterized protein n=1 Tax=Rhizophora mucronata TaxID=61149 RepID=A0A2P2JEA4_RHIMU